MAVGGRRLLAGAVAVLLAGAVTACEPTAPRVWSVERVSERVPGGPGAEREMQFARVAPGGGHVLFMSEGGDFGVPDDDNVVDIYVHDLATGTTILASTAPGGLEGSAASPAFSPDGTRLAFSMVHETGQVPPVLTTDLYVRDLVSGTVVDVPTDDLVCGPGAAWPSDISADGTKVLYKVDRGFSSAGPGVDIYVTDITTGATTHVAPHTTLSGCAGDSSWNEYPVFSPDDQSVLFETESGDHGPVDTNDRSDIYLFHLTTSTTTLVSTNATGDDSGNDDSQHPTFSPDGTRIVFDSQADDLGPLDTNDTTDIYVEDLITGDVTLVSVNTAGTDSANSHSAGASFSPDGASVAFSSPASDLDPLDDDPADAAFANYDVYLRDLDTGTTALVSANAEGTDSANGYSSGAAFLDTGEIVYVSDADDLGPTDSPRGGRESDIYLHNPATGTTSLVSTNAEGTDSADAYSDSAWGLSSDRMGTTIAFLSSASDLRPGAPETDGLVDVYAARRHAADIAVDLDAAPSPVAIGDTLTYRITVDNHGPSTATGTKASLLLPTATSYQAAITDDGTCEPPPPGEPRLVACTLSDLAPDATADITITATVTAADTDLEAVAATSSDTPDPAPDNDLTHHITTTTP